MAQIEINLNEFNDNDLIEELQSRGYKVIEDGIRIDRLIYNDLFKLFKSWDCDRPETFDKNMRTFYNDWYKEMKNVE